MKELLAATSALLDATLKVTSRGIYLCLALFTIVSVMVIIQLSYAPLRVAYDSSRVSGLLQSVIPLVDCEIEVKDAGQSNENTISLGGARGHLQIRRAGEGSETKAISARGWQTLKLLPGAGCRIITDYDSRPKWLGIFINGPNEMHFEYRDNNNQLVSSNWAVSSVTWSEGGELQPDDFDLDLNFKDALAIAERRKAAVDQLLISELHLFSHSAENPPESEIKEAMSRLALWPLLGKCVDPSKVPISPLTHRMLETENVDTLYKNSLLLRDIYGRRNTDVRVVQSTLNGLNLNLEGEMRCHPSSPTEVKVIEASGIALETDSSVVTYGITLKGHLHGDMTFDWAKSSTKWVSKYHSRPRPTKIEGLRGVPFLDDTIRIRNLVVTKNKTALTWGLAGLGLFLFLNYAGRRILERKAPLGHTNVDLATLTANPLSNLTTPTGNYNLTSGNLQVEVLMRPSDSVKVTSPVIGNRDRISTPEQTTGGPANPESGPTSQTDSSETPQKGSSS